jgi:hypothetical protein
MSLPNNSALRGDHFSFRFSSRGRKQKARHFCRAFQFRNYEAA